MTVRLRTDVSAAELQERLECSMARRDVPGAQVAVLHGGKIVEAAHGVADMDSGRGLSSGTGFLFGCVMKLFTATLVMDLVEQGRLSLDTPIRRYLRNFRVADPDVSSTVTARHLITHTSGIDGNFHVDFGGGPDRFARYVEACRELPQLTPPGAMHAYCNAAFVIATHLIQTISDRPWEEHLRNRLVIPLGLRDFRFPGERKLPGTVAYGHVRDDKSGRWRVIEPATNRSTFDSVGGNATLSARDLVRFAQAHMDEPSGATLLRPDTVRRMRRSVRLSDPRPELPAWRHGWMNLAGNRIGHDGVWQHQSALLTLDPRRNIALATVANGGRPHAVSYDLFPWLRERLQGEARPTPRRKEPKEAIEPRFKAEDLVGAYECIRLRYTVRATGQTLRIEEEARPGNGEARSPSHAALEFDGQGSYRPVDPDGVFMFSQFRFLKDRHGTPDLLWVGPFQLCRKVA